MSEAMSDARSTGGPPAVLVSDRQHRPLDQEGLAALARSILIAEGQASAELSLSFVDEAEIEDLHVRFMGEPGPTDVLSFPLGDVDEDGVRLLGDVVIAPDVAVRNNPSDPEGEIRLLLVHGILHLLGYDHEEEEEKTEMWARQEAYSGVKAP
jgi:probable rRNA maturation factor